MTTATRTIEELANREYQYGFVTDVEAETVPKGLNEEVVRLISEKKREPAWLLEWRLKAYRTWLTMTEPTWQNVRYPAIDYQDIIYYSAPKKRPTLNSLDEVDPEIRATFEKLGIPLEEQKLFAGVAVDAVFDSVSVATTFRTKLAELGIIFCSFSEAVQEHPDLVRKYLGTVVPYTDNFFATLNSAVFSDGSFAYIPKGVRCPMELSTYFRINARNSGQFERTLLIADEGAHVSYLEGCTAPMRDENQLHAAVVELVALDNATIKYSTIQNWYPGDKDGKGGIFNFVTKRGKAAGVNHVEVPRLHPAWRQFDRRVLFSRDDQQLAASRHRHQDDPHRPEHEEHDRVEGDLGGARPEHLPRHGEDRQAGARRAQLLAVRLAAHRRSVRRPHVPVPGDQEHVGASGARGVHVEDRRGPDLLLPPARPLDRGRREPDRQRVLPGSLPRAADGVRRGSAEAPQRQSGRQRRLSHHDHA